MNWGIRVVIILALFLAGMTYMVALAMRQTNETVDTDYYSKELKYQKVIDGKKQLAALGEPVSIADSAGAVWIHLPPAAMEHLDSGHIEFLRFSSSKADRRIPMSVAGRAAYSLPLASFVKGWYRVRMEWVSDGMDYYHEQNFQIR